jgi:hypothetical protein
MSEADNPDCGTNNLECGAENLEWQTDNLVWQRQNLIYFDWPRNLLALFPNYLLHEGNSC